MTVRPSKSLSSITKPQHLCRRRKVCWQCSSEHPALWDLGRSASVRGHWCCMHGRMTRRVGASLPPWLWTRNTHFPLRKLLCRARNMGEYTNAPGFVVYLILSLFLVVLLDCSLPPNSIMWHHAWVSYLNFRSQGLRLRATWWQAQQSLKMSRNHIFKSEMKWVNWRRNLNILLHGIGIGEDLLNMFYLWQHNQHMISTQTAKLTEQFAFFSLMQNCVCSWHLQWWPSLS